MERTVVIGLVSAAFVAATLLAPFTHLHTGVPHDHLDRPSHHSHGVVHTHLAAHEDHVRGGPAGTAGHWDPDDRTSSVSLDTLLSELSRSPITLVTRDGAYDPPLPEKGAGRPVVTLPRAHGPPEAFPVIGRAPPA